MTDIDALVAEARKLFLIGIAPGGEETIAGLLFTTLIAERAKVAALDADVKRLNKALTADEAVKFAKAVAHAARIASLEAEGARWREVAMELAGALGDAFQHGEIMTSERRMNRCGAALTRFKQENSQ